MSDNVFVDKATGEQVRIINEDTNFYVLDNSVSIKKDVFSRKYEERFEVDPNAFFKPKLSADPLLNMAQQLKSMDTSKINDSQDSGARVKYISQPVVLSDNSGGAQQAVKQPQSEETIQLSAEEKRKMMDEWRRTQPGAQIPKPVADNSPAKPSGPPVKPLPLDPQPDDIVSIFPAAFVKDGAPSQ